jgi:hypothetical protein
MDLRAEILKADFKERVVYVADVIGNNPERFEILIELFMSSDARTCQRASWVLGHCTDNYPDMIIPYLPVLVKNLFNTPEDAVKRNTLRAMQEIEIPEELWGETIEIAFQFLMGNEAIAIKVFAMTVLYNLCLKIPEIREELRVVIEDQLPYGSAGFQNRGSKLLVKLDKLKN